MKALIVTGLLLTSIVSTQAQTTKLGSAGNKAMYGNTNPRPKIGAGSTGSSTVDGSNGSATNDGASGQSGSPAPLPMTSAGQTSKYNSRTVKKDKRKTSRTLHQANNTATL